MSQMMRALRRANGQRRAYGLHPLRHVVSVHTADELNRVAPTVRSRTLLRLRMSRLVVPGGYVVPLRSGISDITLMGAPTHWEFDPPPQPLAFVYDMCADLLVDV